MNKYYEEAEHLTSKTARGIASPGSSYLRRLWLDIVHSRQLYVLFALPFLYFIVFKYIPMAGVQIAFKNYRAIDGIWNSPYVGLAQFERLFSTYQFTRIVQNTLIISVYSLIIGVPFPMILALSLNYVRNRRYKKTVQMVSYAPYFISTVVMCSMILQFLSPRTGFINQMISALGGAEINFIGNPEMFSSIYVWTGLWQGVGYSSIIYLAALAGISPELHEAALMDGANVLQRIWHIDLPGILPTAIILLIMNTGQLLNVGFEKVLLLQNPLNLRTSEIIDTYVYKMGLSGNVPNFSFATAIGLLKSVVGLILITSVNALAKRVSSTSLW